MTTFDDDARRRLWIRSIRRGMKEMDIILTDFAARRLAAMTTTELAAYEALLQQNDQSLFAWLMGHEDAPVEHQPVIVQIQADLRAKTKAV